MLKEQLTVLSACFPLALTQKAMVLEVDMRWCGDANISLAIEFNMG